MTIEAVKNIGLVMRTPIDNKDDDLVKVKCVCVNGECLPGQSICHNCYKGWKGRLCDIPDESGSNANKPSVDKRMRSAKI